MQHNEPANDGHISSGLTRVQIRDEVLACILAEYELQNIKINPRYWHHGDPNTFDGGHRGCIDQDLARFELTLIMIGLMQRGITFGDIAENTGDYAEELTCYPTMMAIRVRFNYQ